MSRRVLPLEEYRGWVDGMWCDTYEIAAEGAYSQHLSEEYERYIGQEYEKWVAQEHWEWQIERSCGWLWGWTEDEK